MANEIPADQLGDIRGGFSLPSGMEISFGFDIATRVGGDVVQQLSVPMTNVPGTGSSVPLSVLSQGASSSVQLSLGSAAPVSVSSLANTGLTSITTTLGAGGISSLIQNQANGQVIQQTRVLDVSISGLTQSLAQQAAHTMMVNALAAASMPRH
ncbi:MAG TPA: hypothetical protein VL574_03045 [Stellaceae bacterium]|nr:hypothetical protein [Stellaceae bacterium]